jgi:hypothetical protein
MVAAANRPSIIALILAVSLFFPPCLSAQQARDSAVQNPAPRKIALVIGNGGYAEPGSLRNPLNDAMDMVDALKGLGFEGILLLDGDLEKMENAISQFKISLGESENSYGLFFFAGHAVQSGGDNYLIPLNARIAEENDLRTRAVSVQALLDDLGGVKNRLNMLVLDACRDNPFGRGGEPGLAAPDRQPENSIIVYAAGAGQTAADGEGRNSVFTIQLLKNLRTPGLEVQDLFRRTGADVSRASGRRQVPVVYSQFSGTAYLSAASGEGDKAVDTARLRTVGASIGISFAAPWIIGTVHGTLAPWRYSFFEIGLDAGFISGYKDVTNYYSFYPFSHYAFFIPFSGAGGWYAGAGGGYMFASYGFPEGKIWDNTWAVDFCTGVIIGDVLTFSYTLRTNFTSANNKLAVGFVKRFK